MADWWVNHNQTRNQEVEGGFLWSPMRNSDQSRNQSYENMRDVRVGDRVFSYASQRIGAIGFVTREAVVATKPDSFGTAGDGWSRDGWLVGVRFTAVRTPLNPREHLQAIAPLLPAKYSPIRTDGNGNQGIYLAGISPALGRLLAELADSSAHVSDVDQASRELIADVEQILSNPEIPETQRAQLVQARVGQGLFRAEVLKLEAVCRVTETSDPRFLRASHIKPWRESSNEERLDGSNGLMLAPHIDLLFDRGFITFEDDGALVISNRLPREVVTTWNVQLRTLRRLSKAQARFMEHHRLQIFKKI